MALEQELERLSPELGSHPVRLTLDPSTACNLKCPFCPTGAGYGSMKRENLTPKNFDRIVSHLRVDLLREVALYNWGEPLLNPHFADFARFFSDCGIPTVTSTNFSQKDFSVAALEKIVLSGLDSLIVSIDGASQPTYERYRVGGSLRRVLENCRRLQEVKKAQGSVHPIVTFKMLLNRYNEHEVDTLQAIADSCGADFLLDQQFWCPDHLTDEWLASSLRSQSGKSTPLGVDDPTATITTYCRQLWDEVIVSADGTVFPCCLVFDPKHAIGNLVEQDISSIRNNQKMVALRRFVIDQEAQAPPFDNHCSGCPSRHCTVQSQRNLLRPAWKRLSAASA